MLPSSKTRRLYLAAAEELRANPDQLALFESQGSAVVMAGPGSGKTKVLTIKLAQVLTEDVSQTRGVACITYNNECARELNTRLRALSVREDRRVFIGTLHRFCLTQILKPFADLCDSDLPDEFKIADTRRQEEVLQRTLDAVLGRQEQASIYRTGFDRYRRTHLDHTSPSWREDNELATVISRYERRLHDSGFVDFDDIIFAGVRLLLSNPWIGTALHAKFPVIFVDEYQDLGHALHELVMHLAEVYGTRIIAVGDPDQSIYGFTGAEPRLLREAADRMKVEPIRLRLNYRSNKRIVDGARILLEEERGMESVSDEIGTVSFVYCPTGIEEQAATIVDKLIPEILKARDGRALGDIAVVYPDQYIGNIIAAACEGKYKTIRLDQGAPYPRTPMTRWLEDCARWCATGWRAGDPSSLRLAYQWQELALGKPNRGDSWEWRRDLVTALWPLRSGELPLHEWLALMKDGPVARILDESNNLDHRDSWTKLVASSAAPLREWTIEGFGNQTGARNHLTLITLHSVKGLEFDAVVMMGMDQGIIPRWRATTAAAKSEQRRLFYVGFTRARHEVYLTYSGFTIAGRTRREDGPSEFLLELQKGLTS